MIRQTLKRFTPPPLLRFYRLVLQRQWRRRMLAAINPPARRLYELSQLTSYDSVRLPERVEQLSIKVSDAARSIYGEHWNYYSDALRREIVEGFVKSIAALSEFRVIDYLEIGSCQGLSMALIGSMLRDAGKLGRLLSIDPYFETGYDEGKTGPYENVLHVDVDKRTKLYAFRLYEELGLPVELKEAPSIAGLSSLLHDDRRFDLIYIDGSHERLWPVVDFGLCCAVVRPGGVVILDDHMWPDVQPLKELCDKHLEKIQETWKTASYRIAL